MNVALVGSPPLGALFRRAMSLLLAYAFTLQTVLAATAMAAQGAAAAPELPLCATHRSPPVDPAGLPIHRCPACLCACSMAACGFSALPDDGASMRLHHPQHAGGRLAVRAKQVAALRTRGPRAHRSRAPPIC
jgi:hypothetical protein